MSLKKDMTRPSLGRSRDAVVLDSILRQIAWSTFIFGLLIGIFVWYLANNLNQLKALIDSISTWIQSAGFLASGALFLIYKFIFAALNLFASKRLGFRALKFRRVILALDLQIGFSVGVVIGAFFCLAVSLLLQGALRQSVAYFGVAITFLLLCLLVVPSISQPASAPLLDRKKWYWYCRIGVGLLLILVAILQIKDGLSTGLFTLLNILTSLLFYVSLAAVNYFGYLDLKRVFVLHQLR
jgi:hypothetical protein